MTHRDLLARLTVSEEVNEKGLAVCLACQHPTVKLWWGYGGGLTLFNIRCESCLTFYPAVGP